jgi:AcrR family transcriptional regulator
MASGDDKSDERMRARILKETLRHIRRYGGQRTRVVAVAQSLGMSHANIYRYFKTKDDLFDELVRRWLREADDVIASNDSADLSPTAVARAFLTLNAFLIQKLNTEPAAIDVFRHAFEHQSNAVAEHVARMKVLVLSSMRSSDAWPRHATADRELFLSMLSTTLEPYLNPLLIHARDHTDDTAQLSLLLQCVFGIKAPRL